MRALRRRQYYQTFDFYFVLQLAATETTTYHVFAFVIEIYWTSNWILLDKQRRNCIHLDIWKSKADRTLHYSERRLWDIYQTVNYSSNPKISPFPILYRKK